MNLTISDIDQRLQGRYRRLVQEHAGHAHPTASGPRLLPDEPSAKAAAMAAWRFYANPATTFTRLAQPLLQAGCEAAATQCRDFALVPLDWSWLDYRGHDSKPDRLKGPGGVKGYKFLSALLLSDRDGQPLAPLCAQLLSARGLLSSRFDRPRRPLSALDELAPLMGFVAGLPLGKPPVFFLDAEGDSIYHYRRWQRGGWRFLARADAQRHVRLGGKRGPDMALPAVAQWLRRQRAFQRTREVEYLGRQVGQYVAEAAVTLDRPAWLNRVVGGRRKRVWVRGEALDLRLVITELRDGQGWVLERWYLLTNVPAAVSAATVALWYYWRWRIETFFKLLKSAGQQVERWQQEGGGALLKRLLVAGMACVLAWRLGHSTAPQAAEARRLVMGLSGRQTEHGREYTLEGLLAGTWVLLALRALLGQMPAERLLEMADFVLAGSPGPGTAESAPPLREAG